MAKWYGAIGFVESVETAPDVHTEEIKEYKYFGDMTRNTMVLQSTDQLNDDVKIGNEISIVANPFAYENFHNMRYITYMGIKWKVNRVEVRPPRLIITVGGVYNA